MFLLALHIVAIAILVVLVWAVAYQRGIRTGERRLRRRLEAQGEAGDGAA